MPVPENLNQEKLAETALANLSLSSFADPMGVRAWEGMDWDLLNMLFEKDWISNPVGKQKSIVMSEEGIKLAEEFLEKHFGK